MMMFAIAMIFAASNFVVDSGSSARVDDDVGNTVVMAVSDFDNCVVASCILAPVEMLRPIPYQQTVMNCEVQPCSIYEIQKNRILPAHIEKSNDQLTALRGVNTRLDIGEQLPFRLYNQYLQCKTG